MVEEYIEVLLLNSNSAKTILKSSPHPHSSFGAKYLTVKVAFEDMNLMFRTPIHVTCDSTFKK